MTNILKPTPITVRRLLKRDEILIPDYQRSYSWQEEQIDEFMEDLESSVDNDQIWFLGILYTHELDEGRSMLLDGQQRVTSMFVLLKELMLFHQNVADPNEAENFKTFARDSLRSLVLEEGTNKAKLTLDVANRNEFSEYLKEEGIDDARIGYDRQGDFARSHELLDEAIVKVRDRLKAYFQIDPFTHDYEKFEKVVLFILDKIELIEIKLSGGAAFHNIFENINDRGLRLTGSDKFKSRYSSLVKDVAAFEQEWFETAKVVYSLKKDLDQSVFDFYFRSIGKNDLDEAGNFYAMVRRSLRRKTDPQKLAELTTIFGRIKEMVRLLRAVERFELIGVFKGAHAENLKRSSKVVNVLVKEAWDKFPQLGVLVFASYFNFRDRSDKDAYVTFLQNLVNAVRFYVAAILSEERANILRGHTIKIAAGLTHEGNRFVDVLDELNLDFPSKLDLSSIDALTFKDNKLSDVLILLIQAHKNASLIDQYDPKHGWSLEHLLPKSWQEHWSEAPNTDWGLFTRAKEAALDKDLSRDDLDLDAKHKIQEFLGNKFLVSLGQNRLATNRELSHKQKQIKDTVNPVIMPGYAGLNSINDYTKFGVVEIVERTKQLAPVLTEALRSRDLPI